jgi:hypothetical protein
LRLENNTLIDEESYAEIVAISFTIPFLPHKRLPAFAVSPPIRYLVTFIGSFDLFD